MEGRRAGALVVALLLAVLIAPSLTARSASPQPVPADSESVTSVGDWSGTEEALTIVSEEQHPNGLVVTRFSNGVTVAGEAGATVSLHETDDGMEGSTELTVETTPGEEPVEGLDDEEPGFTTRDAALAIGIDEDALAELGLDDCEWLSEEACEQDAGGAEDPAGAESMLQPVPPTPALSASGCAEINTGQTYAWGCWNRYRGETRTNAFYNGYHSSVAAKSKSIYRLSGASTRHNFTNGRSVMRSPNDTVDVGSCRTDTFGVSGYGVQATTSSQACPERVHTTVEATRYWIDWRGSVTRDNTRAAEGVQIVETPKGKTDGHRYSIATSWNV